MFCWLLLNACFVFIKIGKKQEMLQYVTNNPEGPL